MHPYRLELRESFEHHERVGRGRSWERKGERDRRRWAAGDPRRPGRREDGRRGHRGRVHRERREEVPVDRGVGSLAAASSWRSGLMIMIIKAAVTAVLGLLDAVTLYAGTQPTWTFIHRTPLFLIGIATGA